MRRLYDRALAQHSRYTASGTIEALALLDQATRLDSDFALGWAAMAHTARFAAVRGWRILGRDPSALLALALHASERAARLDSTSAQSWLILAHMDESVDYTDRTLVIRAVRRALAIDPSNADAWFDLGLAQEELLHPFEALAAWRRAAALAPRNTMVLAFLGWHNLWYDDYAAGTRWTDSALALDPTFGPARQAAAQLALVLHHPDDAERYAEAEMTAPGGRPVLGLCLLARAAAERGEWERGRRYAVRAESSAARTATDKHDAAYLGAAWAALRDTTRALRWLAAYEPRADVHYQLHLKRDPALRWLHARHSSLLTP